MGYRTRDSTILFGVILLSLLAACSSSDPCLPFNDTSAPDTGLAYRADPPDGRPAILFIGDSFTYGFGVQENETLVAFLQEMLDRNGYDYQVVNLGMYGYNAPLVLERLEKSFPRYPGTELIIYLYVDDYIPSYSALGNPHYRPLPKMVFLFLDSQPFAPLSQESREVLRVRLEGHYRGWAGKHKRKLLECKVRPSVEGMVALAGRIPIAVFRAPYHSGEEAMPMLIRMEGITYLPLAKTIEESIPMDDESRAAYEFPDGHPNPAGHRLLAEELFRQLAERELVRKDS